MGHAWGAKKAAADSEAGAEGEEAQVPAPELWALEGGAPWPQALDTVSNLAPENVRSLGKDPGLA